MGDLNLSMTDFTSPFWSWFIAIGTLLSIAFCFWLIWWMTGGNAMEKTGSGQEGDDTTGHKWDDDLQEYNNPLPSWWLGMFYLTLFFGLGYLFLYPGLGAYAGYLNWTSRTQYNAEMDAAETEYGPIYAQYSEVPIPQLAKDDDALEIGKRLYLNYCTVCHGSDAGGTPGFPNLKDDDWLYGGSPEKIQESILNGRKANGMVAWKDTLGGEQGVKNVAQYVLKLSGNKHDEEAAAKGMEKYNTICVACHGPEGKGNQMLGAPNLSDDTWLYGGSVDKIEKSIAEGRQGVMPAHKDFLGEDKVHLLAAYIYSLGEQAKGSSQTASQE